MIISPDMAIVTVKGIGKDCMKHLLDLSLKSVFEIRISESHLSNEIDTGISGEISSKVAHKIYEISLTTQVISITRLPQVAALSKNHVKISKDIRNNRTYTSIKYLN